MEPTLAHVASCDWQFDSRVFSVSDLARDFISKLLIKSGPKRMTVHESLDHPWIKEDHTEFDKRISATKYLGVRTRIHNKYGIDLNSKQPAIGIISNFSSIRRLRMEEYKLYVSEFDRKEAVPRFIVKPGSSVVPENSTVNFRAVIFATSDPW
ncbi:unc-22 [Bugula neritina]|uniref:Unc-22 n=1 Tax=Bugula neritina TaxID=10212 RepID=A0A7J7JVY5_BUGNE|nr:unc-22 [Bugula neritina]